jgi:hypothetical protein
MASTAAASPVPTTADLDDKPIDSTLFADKVFYIAPGLFKEYDDKLRADIEVSSDGPRCYMSCLTQSDRRSFSSTAVLIPIPYRNPISSFTTPHPRTRNGTKT